jgi:adenosylcobinamide kinase/adenosylcobinamide-phosphate guanylyltransferase
MSGLPVPVGADGGDPPIIRLMRVVMRGTGGTGGWPEPDCPCASCAGAARTGVARAPSTVEVDGTLRFDLGGPPRVGAGAGGGASAGGGADRDRAGTGVSAGGGGHIVREVPGGWDVTGPDGQRLLCARTGEVPEPPEDARPYDYAVLDMLGDPTWLGLLRVRGLVTDSTRIGLACADHRAASEHELTGLCEAWEVQVPRDGCQIEPRRYAAKRRVLVVGGARSGKSERAERRVAAQPDVTYVATGPDRPGDGEWAARVAEHRARRPAWWRTAETTELAAVLRSATGTLLIDGIGTWLASVMDECGVWDGDPVGRKRLAARTDELVRAWRETLNYVVAVSDEVGLGVIPETPAGRLFRDELGKLNQALSRESEMTEFVLAGRVLPLPLW